MQLAIYFYTVRKFDSYEVGDPYHSNPSVFDDDATSFDEFIVNYSGSGLWRIDVEPSRIATMELMLMGVPPE